MVAHLSTQEHETGRSKIKGHSELQSGVPDQPGIQRSVSFLFLFFCLWKTALFLFCFWGTGSSCVPQAGNKLVVILLPCLSSAKDYRYAPHAQLFVVIRQGLSKYPRLVEQRRPLTINLEHPRWGLVAVAGWWAELCSELQTIYDRLI